MGYNDLMRRMADEHALMSVLLELTYRCNLDCFFCYNDIGLSGDRLSTEDYLQLLEDLRDLQVMVIVLSGGEPLASPAFWPIGKKAQELGFITRIKSNGHALTKDVATRIKIEIDPYVVEVSLHGARAATHDRQTRVQASFEKLMANLRDMREVGLRIKLNATLTRWNEQEIERMFALADRMELPLSFDPVVTPGDNGDRKPLSICASAESVKRLYTILGNRKSDKVTRQKVAPRQNLRAPGQAGRKNCGTGSATLAVDPFGNVYPCIQWRRAVGNLHRQSIKEIWGGSPALNEVRRLNAEAGRRVDRLGPMASDMGFCLGLAEELMGDPLAIYPQAERNLKVLRELQVQKETIPLPIYGQD